MTLSPQIGEVFAFLLDHGVLLAGAFLTLAAMEGRRFGPLRFLVLVVGLAFVVSGLSEFVRT
jgi:hypothetical protein